MPSKKKEIDFDRYNERHILLSLSYLGHGFSGLAFQRKNMNTIEECLFDALRRTKLCRFKPLPEEKINSIRGSLTLIPVGFSRCGRTDSDVSAFANGVALHMRSNLGPKTHEVNSDLGKCLPGLVKLGSNVEKSKGYSDDDEIDYIYLLNKRLPPSIRVTSWSAVDEQFDARHSCISRSYRYYFFPTDYDVGILRKLCCEFIGLHNFINFCKKDPLIDSYWRRIYEFEVIDCPEGKSMMTYFYVRGNAFLHHQIRYMVSLLFEIASGRLEETALTRYLHTENAIQDREFCLATPENLCFWGCIYDSRSKLSWNYSFKGRNIPDSGYETVLPLRSEKAPIKNVGKTNQVRKIQDPVDTGFANLYKKTLTKAILLSEMDIATRKVEAIYLFEKRQNVKCEDETTRIEGTFKNLDVL